MPVGYGANFQPPEITSSEIGTTIITTSTSEDAGILSIISIIGEVIGSILLPEAAPLIAIGGASARLGIEAGYGEKISPLGTAIDFAGGIIPGVSAGIGNLRVYGRMGKGLGAIESSADRTLSSISATRNAVSSTRNNLRNTFLSNRAVSEGAGFARQTITRDALDFFRSRANVVERLSGQAREGFQTGFNFTNATVGRIGFEQFSTAYSSVVSEAGLSRVAIGSKIVSGGASGSVEDVIQTARRAGLSEEFIQELLAYEAKGYAYRSIRSIFIDELIRNVGRQEALRIIRELPEAQDIIKNLQILELSKNERKGIGKSFRYAIKHPIKFAKSSQGDSALQWIQNIFDGNDLGRFLIEKPYSMIKEEIDKVFKGLKPVIKNAEKVEDAWEKTGGVLVDSQVILGYKVIQESKNPLGHNLIMIKFYPEPTKGKKPVFVRATALQMEKLAHGPGVKGMAYYLKTWAVSKGGKRGNAFLKVPPQLRFMLHSTTSFLPVGALRWFESLSSNIVGSFLQHSAKDGYSFKWTGVGSSEYSEKIGQTVGHTFANRVSRMFTRVIAGGYAKYRIGSKSPIAKFIGSELQRFSGAGVNTAFDISGMTGRSRLTAGQIATRNFRTAGLQGVKGATSYTNRRLASGSTGLGSSYIRQSIGTRRSLNIYQRPLSSLSGGGARLTSFGKFKI